MKLVGGPGVYVKPSSANDQDVGGRRGEKGGESGLSLANRVVIRGGCSDEGRGDEGRGEGGDSARRTDGNSKKAERQYNADRPTSLSTVVGNITHLYRCAS